MRLTTPALKLAGMIATAAILGACGGGKGGENSFTPPPTATVPPPPVNPSPQPPPPPPSVDGTPQGMAGAGFATAFNQGKFDEPVSPTQGDIIAIDKSADPYDIPNP